MERDDKQKFYFGASTSAHQVEGNNHNDWSEWEEKNAVGLAKEAEAKRKDPAFAKIALELLNHHNYVSGAACDHYHRFREDFDIAKSLGHNAHRFSIEWSRIEPEEGKFDEKEIEHYREVIRALCERGLEPFVTLWHWTLPLWFRDRGGWEWEESPKYFARYVEKIVAALETRHPTSSIDVGCLSARHWITLNEPEVYTSHSYLKGEWPPQKRSLVRYITVTRHLVCAHKKAYRVIKKYVPGAEVGIAKNNIYFEAVWWNPVAWLLKLFADYFWNYYFLNRIMRYQDFIGLNYYFHNRISWWFGRNKNKSVTDIGWEIYPEGLYYVLRGLRWYRKPIYVTENGLADRDDEKRADFLRNHIAIMRKAMGDGVDVRGYLYWSLIDNFEWSRGFAPRFGLVAVDYKTFERRIRPSALEYKKIIEENLKKDTGVL